MEDGWQFHAALYVGILANVNVGSNFFIYLGRSEEFRKYFFALVGIRGLDQPSQDPRDSTSKWYPLTHLSKSNHM